MRDRLLDAVERMLARYGYQKTTMDDIAREAGVAKRTIYMHFASKEEVALSSIDRVVERLTERLHNHVHSNEPPAERLRKMLTERVLFRFDSVRGYHQSLDDLFVSLRPAYLARRQCYFKAEAEIFAVVLFQGKDCGAFTCADALETAHTLLMATNALLPYSLSVRELGQRRETERRAARIADLLIEGLRARREN
jgi:AcrR family transcriptional regulator